MNGVSDDGKKQIKEYFLNFSIRNLLLPYRKYILEKRTIEKKLEDDF